MRLLNVLFPADFCDFSKNTWVLLPVKNNFIYETIFVMQIKYGTLTEYTYFIHQYDMLIKQNDQCTLAHFTHKNLEKLRYTRDLQQKILASGALDPANPQTKTIIGEDLYDIPTQNGILFYPTDAQYIQNIIHNDQIYRLLPKTPNFLLYNDTYAAKKVIINYEYFLTRTNPPTSTRRALTCIIGTIVNFIEPNDPRTFHNQLNIDRFFIERWFEKIR